MFFVRQEYLVSRLPVDARHDEIDAVCGVSRESQIVWLDTKEGSESRASVLHLLGDRRPRLGAFELEGAQTLPERVRNRYGADACRAGIEIDHAARYRELPTEPYHV